MNDIIRYIIRFLLGDETPAEVADLIGYTSDERAFPNYKVVILPSGFFDDGTYGTPASLPSMPLQQYENVPVLFGNPCIETKNDILFVHTDIIAGSYFLLSRYEETICRKVRDEHGRFTGRASLPFRAGFLHRPVVDEYGRLLRGWLTQTGVKISESPSGIRRINLTHDVDAPFAMRTWRNVLRGIKEGQKIGTLLRVKFGALEDDPNYTFPWLLDENCRLETCCGKEHCQSLFFFRAGGADMQDKPRYNLQGKDMQSLLALIADSGGVCGLHSSYQAGREPSLVAEEKAVLEQILGRKVTINRHHYLTSREPEDMAALENAGITDDYTMGYADVAGFRLGTSRPVQWIDVKNRRLSSLILHPLTVMDGTLWDTKYMGLDHLAAKSYCDRLIEQVRRFHGELTLLWHNTAFVDDEISGYLKILYRELLDELIASSERQKTN